MRSLIEWARLVRRLAGPGSLRGQALVALVVLIERLIAPLVVLAAARSGVGLTVVAVLAVAVLALVQRGTQRILSAQVEARLYQRTVAATLRADVLQRSVLPEDEAHAVLFEGMQAVVSLLVTGLPGLMASGLAACVLGVVVAATQPVGILAAAAVGCGLGAAVILGSRRATGEAWRRLTPLWGRLADGVTNAFDGRLDIVASGRTEAYEEAYAETVRLWKAARLRSEVVATFAGRLPLLMTAATVGGGVILEGMARGESLGPLLFHAAFLGSMAPAFVGVTQGLQDNLRNAPRLRAMDALLAVRPDEARGTTAPQTPISRIELRDVRFVYRCGGGSQRLALAGVSFAWGRGELVGLAGSNGSGKSTCLHATLGTARPVAGDVWIDGVPLARIDLERWRRLVAYLPQRPYLPPRATMRACLGFLEPGATDARMMVAMARVGLSHLGLDASVDALSVGQRQRVGIARLLCSDRPVVLLDEPDAALDPSGVDLVIQICRDLAGERLVLVAAHSVELRAAADRVVVLEEGRVVSGGNAAPI